MVVLGVNAYHGDASAALLIDGRLVAAAEEERFNRIKHSAGLPIRAIEYCLAAGGLRLCEVEHIAVSRDPRAHLLQKIVFAFSRRPQINWLRSRLDNSLSIRDIGLKIASSLGDPSAVQGLKIHFVEHHRSHMASAFFPSPFEEAACLSLDGFGDFLSAMWGIGQTRRIKELGQVPFPHSIGIFYTAVTQYLGFRRYGDEYKVMGLAPYGEPEYLEGFRKILRPTGRGFSLKSDYFRHDSGGISMDWVKGEPEIGCVYSDLFVKRFGPPRTAGEALDQRHKNLAASVQAITEETCFHLLKILHERTRTPKLCLAGGVAFNSVANGKITRNTPFQEVYIQPAAGDAGTALGAAAAVFYSQAGERRDFILSHAFWGPEFSEESIWKILEARSAHLSTQGAVIARHEDEELCEAVATHLAAGKIAGWFQGRMEWGPRALGNRSILADPRRTEMKDILNARIKRREPFRPFCPSILREHLHHYFEDARPDPFMLTVHQIRPEKRKIIPAVTHVDGSGRIQTVTREDNPLYYRLLQRFCEKTGVPVLLNTSFNENEPIVLGPEEAVNCFLRTRMDLLAIGPFLIERPCMGSNGGQSAPQKIYGLEI